jgi:cell division septation protein DedD
LDTLQILCNHSKEDIDALMHAAAAAEEQEQQEQEHQQKQSSSPSKNELALLQITDIVKEMLKNDMIGPAVAEMFQRLIKASDARLIAAYEKYTQNKNGAELVDTLLRIVVASVEGTSAPPTSSAASASKTSPAKPQQSSPAKSSPSPAASPSSSSAGANESILDANDQKKVVEILFK